MRHMERLFGEMQQRGARTFEVTEEANARFLERMTTLMKDSAFELGNCVDLAVLLVQEPHRQGRSAAVPSDIGAQRREGAGPIPDVGLRDSLTRSRSPHCRVLRGVSTDISAVCPIPLIRTPDGPNNDAVRPGAVNARAARKPASRSRSATLRDVRSAVFERTGTALEA